MKAFAILCLLILPLNQALAADCGTTGTIPERVANCARQHVDTTGGIWNLVTRIYSSYMDQNYDVWQESATGDLWSQGFLASQEVAMAICKPDKLHEVTGRIAGNWSLASVDDYKKTDGVGVLRGILSQASGEYEFWTNVDSQMVDVRNWRLEANHPANAMPVVCRMTM